MFKKKTVTGRNAIPRDRTDRIKYIIISYGRPRVFRMRLVKSFSVFFLDYSLRPGTRTAVGFWTFECTYSRRTRNATPAAINGRCLT